MKGIDFGQGIGDLASQIKLMLMLKKLMPQQGGQPKFGGAGAVGQAGPSIGGPSGSIGGAMGQPPMTSMPQNRFNPQQGAAMTGAGQNPMSSLPPEMLQAIMQRIMGMRGGGGQMGGGMGQMG